MSKELRMLGDAATFDAGLAGQAGLDAGLAGQAGPDAGLAGQAGLDAGQAGLDPGLDAAQARAQLGGKAATLARLASLGFPVPPGFVVTAPALAGGFPSDDSLVRAAVAVGEGGSSRFAVRSSAVAEDLPEASFAGQYETVLDVPVGDLPRAVRQVLDSAAGSRASSYVEGLAESTGLRDGTGMAVLVQVMVDADAAGVAFTANPLTGDRREVIVAAVRGPGERLVSGNATGERWTVRADTAPAVSPGGPGDPVLTAEEAADVADLARRVESALGSGQPQDIEWAISAGRLVLLQARPMTALPEDVSWQPPHDGWWLRNFRLGEWLPEPVTPLFGDWLLPCLESGIASAMSAELGLALRPDSALVHGWYYTTPPPKVDGSLPFQLWRHPRVLAGLPSTIRFLLRPERVPGRLAQLTDHWRTELLPRYRAVVAEGEARIGSSEQGRQPAALVETVDRVAAVAGEYSWSIATLAGSQWKIEAALSRFCRRHLPDLGDSPLLLVSGLPGTEPDLPAHAAHSIDWFWPLAGDADLSDHPGSPAGRHRDLAARREALETAARRRLCSMPRLRRRFDRLLALAQLYAVIREQQTREFTLGWPLLRRCALTLGERLVAQGTLGDAEDVFFLSKAEVEAALPASAEHPLQLRWPVSAGRGGGADPSLQAVVAKRRTSWEQQRRLAAPLSLGTALAAGRRFYANAIAASRTGDDLPDGALVGEPASPGRAEGPVRVVLDPAAFATFRAGEVLVTRATAPAWTPLFARAAAVVTDGGSLAAHASLVAREYGIPAVVGTGYATHRLRTGQTVIVDGSAGTVEVVGP